MGRKLKNSRLNPSAGRHEGEAADTAAYRSEQIDRAFAGATDSPMGEGTTPLSFEERQAAKQAIKQA
jgi:hypothetical protein